MPKRLERLPRYYQRREDNGLMRSRVRVRVPAPLIGRVLNDDGNAVRNQILRVQDRQPVRGTDHVLARATVVLSIPPNPTVVSRRWRGSREACTATTSSRPIIRVAASGRLCIGALATVWGSGASGGSPRLTGATKL